MYWFDMQNRLMLKKLLLQLIDHFSFRLGVEESLKFFLKFYLNFDARDVSQKKFKTLKSGQIEFVKRTIEKSDKYF